MRAAHLVGGLAAIAHRAEVVEHDHQIFGVDEVEERAALDRRGGVTGDAAEVVTAREGDRAVRVEDRDGEGLDGRRGTSSVARFRHPPASHYRSRRP